MTFLRVLRYLGKQPFIPIAVISPLSIAQGLIEPCPRSKTADFVDFLENDQQEMSHQVHDNRILNGVPITNPSWYPFLVTMHRFISDDIFFKECPTNLVKHGHPPDQGCWDTQKRFKRKQFTLWCSAVLINHLWIATARYCLQWIVHGDGCIVNANKDTIHCFDPSFDENLIVIMGTTDTHQFNADEAFNYVRQGVYPSIDRGVFRKIVETKFQNPDLETTYDDIYHEAVEGLTLAKLNEYIEFGAKIRPIYIDSWMYNRSEEVEAIIATGYNRWVTDGDENKGQPDALDAIHLYLCDEQFTSQYADNGLLCVTPTKNNTRTTLCAGDFGSALIGKGLSGGEAILLGVIYTTTQEGCPRFHDRASGLELFPQLINDKGSNFKKPKIVVIDITKRTTYEFIADSTEEGRCAGSNPVTSVGPSPTQETKLSESTFRTELRLDSADLPTPPATYLFASWAILY